MQEVETYVTLFQNTAMKYITTSPTMDLCLTAVRRLLLILLLHFIFILLLLLPLIIPLILLLLIILLGRPPCPYVMRIVGLWCSTPYTESKETLDSVT